jgi:glycosyltransferase involved in cell wall biosynthesis
MAAPTVLMTGPLPPAVGGMASVLGALGASSLSQQVSLRLFETGKTTPPGRPLWLGVVARLRLLRDWWRLLGSARQPVAHIHTCSGLTFFLDGLLLLLARGRGVPVLLHVHGARFDDFLDGLPRPLAALARAIGAGAQGVIALSPEWRDRLARRWPAARLHVVANGVCPPAAAQAVGAGGPPSFAFVGSLGRRKGVHLLLDAAAQACVPWRVELAGGDEEPGFGAWAASEIERRGLMDRVVLLGPVVGPAKDRWLAAAQGFVLPSLAEGLPMALLEAMSAGLPVVVSAVGAMPEVVRDRVEGRVVPAGDAAALAAALDALATAPAERLRLGRAAAERCQGLYGIERMVQALLDLYAALPAGRR